jgi:SAM-dependent methyltransferase
MPGDSYKLVPYPTVPMAQTHPDRLASVATLFGMTPAPVAACRVLEVGCGNGGNLVPMAYFLPGSRFTGVDLAERAIETGRRSVTELDLANLELKAMDLRDIGASLGQFDFIVAHGLYSWIPDSLRDPFLAMCRERLAPEGVACVSYNTFPGRHVPLMLREMMSYHTRNCSDDLERIEQARDLLRRIRENHLYPHTWQPLIDEEIDRMLNLDPGLFLHDDLAEVNDCFTVRDFAARASRHSLQYLGDAEAHFMLGAGDALDGFADDLLEREQYLDFLFFRRFRHTLLCHQEVQLDRRLGPERMDRFLFSSTSRPALRPVIGPHADRLMATLRAQYPLPVPFDKLRECVEDREALRTSLFALIGSGTAQFHVYDYPSHVSVSARPRSSRLARWESARAAVVTYSTHTPLRLDDLVHELIRLLDGTRDIEEIVPALAALEDAPSPEEIRARLPRILARLAKTGLLEG